MSGLSYEQMVKLVRDNNRSKIFSDKFVICLAWKETNFDPEVVNGGSTATGLMQLTKGAVDLVNKNSPAGIHFSHDEMTDAAKNIQCGTYYLDICKTKLAGVDKSFGTGAGYSKSICACEKALKNDGTHPMAALQINHR